MIKDHFEPVTKARVIQLLDQFLEQKYQPGRCWNLHISCKDSGNSGATEKRVIEKKEEKRRKEEAREEEEEEGKKGRRRRRKAERRRKEGRKEAEEEENWTTCT
ncbi:hypothetical protein TNCV_3154431 [Trichonephila clavipes]|nr:hypothetical protein TNCV_3154431 [Trichonephila clavipes]